LDAAALASLAIRGGRRSPAGIDVRIKDARYPACVRVPTWAQTAVIALAHWQAGAAAVLVVLVALTAALEPLFETGDFFNVALLYLLVTLGAAAAWGYRVGLVSAVASELLVNFFFVRPRHALTVQEPRNLVELAVFLVVALVGATMLARLRRQVAETRARQTETGALLDLSRVVAHAQTPGEALERLCVNALRTFGARSVAIVESSEWRIAAATGGIRELTREERIVASEALRADEIVRQGAAGVARVRSDTAKEERAVTLVPFGSGESKGVLRLSGVLAPPPRADTSRLLRAFADEAGLAMERRRLGREAARAEGLREADEFKSVLLSSVSHDLRSPLTAIKAAVGSLRDESIDWSADDRGAFLETIESQTDRLSRTVGGLLDMSRLEAGAVRVDLERIDARLFLAEAARAAEGTIGARPNPITVDDPTWFSGDYALLLQAAGNLIENAAKYSRPGGAIDLRAVQRQNRVELSVADEGPGIPSDELPHLFEKFYRGSAAAKTRGSGLGLAITRAMVERSGGHIQVQSGEGGTTFVIDLPAATAPSNGQA